MAINLRTSPYYDDFDIEKNFHRILFKPGYAVQARELTQLQTILQEQVKRFGNHIFKDGSVVLGCEETFQFGVPYVKINDTNSLGTAISDTAYSTYTTSLVDATVTNAIGVSAKLIRLDESPAGQRVLYLNYQTASTDGATVVFSDSDVLTIVDSSGTTVGDKFVAISSSSTGTGSLYTIGDGIVYAQGNFVRHAEITQVLEYFSATPTKNVGYRIIEEAVTSDDDVSLLDPAAGSYNYSAPGADRYKLSTSLETYALTATPDSGFYLLFIVDSGTVKRAFNKPQYADIQRALAQRTFDESGSYVTSGLNINVREHLKTTSPANGGRYTSGEGGLATKLVYGIEPGKAYVEGYETELKSTEYIAVDKSTATTSADDREISSFYGGYVYVKSVYGDWNIADTNLGVNLLDGSSNIIARAKVQLLKHHSGTPGTGSSSFYKLYLYDVVSAGSYSVADYNTIVTIVDTATGTTHVATVADTDGGDTIAGVIQPDFRLHELRHNTLIFPTNEKAVVEYETNGTSFYFWKKLGTYNFSGNAATVATGDVDHVWGFSSTLSTSATVAPHFLAVKESDNTIATLTGATYASSTSSVLSAASISGNHTVYAYVKHQNANPITLTLNTSYLKLDGSTFTSTSATNLTAGKIYLGVSHALDIESVHIATSGSSYPASYSALLANTSWTDITSSCTLVDGQTDNLWGTSYIQYSGGVDLTTKKIVIKYRNYSRSSSFGYLNRNSYASSLIDYDPTSFDTGRSIYTYELPKYKSNSTGITYDLRDVLDFRPTLTNRTGHSGSAYNSAEVVDGENVTVLTIDATGTWGVTIPDPASTITTTFTYNLPRKDKIVLTRDGQFKVLEGVSSTYPVAPRDVPHAMTLALVEVAPYPSLAPFTSRLHAHEDYSSVVRLVDNRRYTMRDIGDIEQRVTRLEHYTALSIVENRVANMFIDDGSGSNMVKKGILVDTFTGHNIGDVFDTSYNASIDTNANVLRAGVTIEDIDLVASGTPNQVGDLIVTGASHTHITFAENPYATKSRAAGNSVLSNYKTGIMRLDPAQDMWLDENVRPDVQINTTNNNDGWEYNANPFNIHWDGWKTNWQGVELTSVFVNEPTTVNGISGIRSYSSATKFVSDITRSMIVSSRIPDNNFRMYGTKVVDLSVVPYIRSQAVSFVITGLKPNTLVKAYFSGEDVSDYCRYYTLPVDNGSQVTIDDIDALDLGIFLSQYEAAASTVGDAMFVNANGELVGQFFIPSNKFRTGNHIFKIEDASGTTSAAAQYIASGIATFFEESIISTRWPDVRQDALSDIQNNIVNRLVQSNPSTFNASSFGDPMAQTFVVETNTDGIFVTKIDLYFKTKPSTTKKFTVQIRETINGVPGNKIVPFSTVTLESSDINVSTDAETETTFTFASPVYLKNNTEYALVLLPENNTNEYELWVSELGQQKIGTTETITQQPYVGTLFIPSNNTSWVQLEDEDLKFTLYKGVFSVSPTTVNLKTAPIDYITFTATGETSYDLKAGDVVKVYDDTQTTLTGTSSVSSSTVTGVSTSFTTEVRVGDRLRASYPLATSSTLTGLITTSGTSLTGSGTLFTTELAVGDLILQADNTTVVGRISEIASDTSATLAVAPGSDVTSISYRARIIVGIVKTVPSNTTLTLEENCRVNLTSGHTLYTDDTSAEGYITEVQGTNAKVYITSGYLVANDKFEIRGKVTSYTDPTIITVNTIGYRDITTLSPNLGILTIDPTTTVDLKYKLKNTAGTVQSAFTNIKNGETTELLSIYRVYSYSYPTYGEYASTVPAIQMQAILDSDNASVTPVLDTRKLSLLGIKNESSTVYITRAVTLDDTADDLRVYLDVKMPEGTSLTVSAKMQRLGDDSDFDSLSWTTLTQTAPSVVNRSTFQEYMYKPSSAVVYHKFAVKVVINTSATNVQTPLIKNLRAVAVI
jgi:hypothetical protein